MNTPVKFVFAEGGKVLLQLNPQQVEMLPPLLQALGEWYDHTSGHDVGPLLNKVANAYVRLKAGTGQPTDRTDLPPIVPGMLAGGLALAREELAHDGHVGAGPLGDPAELDQESLDAFKRACREKLIRETAEAWKTRPEIETTREISTSGYVAVLPDPVADDARQAYDSRYSRSTEAPAVTFPAWLKAYRHFVGLEVAAVKGSDIEALAKSYAD